MSKPKLQEHPSLARGGSAVMEPPIGVAQEFPESLGDEELRPAPAPRADPRDAQIAQLQERVIALEAKLQTDHAKAAATLADLKQKEWAQLSTAQKTQLEADRLFGADGGDIWEVAFPHNDSPPARFPAHSRDEAIAKYNRLCGINSTPAEQKHDAKKVQSRKGQ